ncbi:MAG: hypothetical protein LBC74_00710, partial [Planctomycetaceae bacterium]|nr:hypothetical protein [Planctomycetaceae bacterium]
MKIQISVPFNNTKLTSFSSFTNMFILKILLILLSIFNFDILHTGVYSKSMGGIHTPNIAKIHKKC